MILPGVEDPRNCMDPTNLGQSKWDQKLGNIEWVLSLYDKMRWKGDDVYLLQGLMNIYSPSLCPPPLPLYHHTPGVAPWRCTCRPGSGRFGGALGDRDRVNSDMHVEAGIERIWWCTWRLGSSELRNALGGRDWASLELHLATEIDWTQRCTWTLGSSEFGDRDWVNSEMHLEALIKRLWRCTWRLRSSELRDALGHHEWSRMEEYLEAVDLEVIQLKVVNLESVNLEAVNLEAVDREACAMEAETLFLGQLVIVGM